MAPDDSRFRSFPREGNVVYIHGGMFEGISGEIIRVDDRHQIAHVRLAIFGRAVPVEVRYSDIERGPS